MLTRVVVVACVLAGGSAFAQLPPGVKPNEVQLGIRFVGVGKIDAGGQIGAKFSLTNLDPKKRGVSAVSVSFSIVDRKTRQPCFGIPAVLLERAAMKPGETFTEQLTRDFKVTNDEHRRLRSTEDKDLVWTFTIHQVLFDDGSREVAKRK